MKIMKKLILIFLLIILCVGCKTSKNTQIQNNVNFERSEYSRLQMKEKEYPYPKLLNWTKKEKK